MSELRDTDVEYLASVLQRSKERRPTWFGERKTNKAEAAEIVMLAYFPALLEEAIASRRVKMQFAPIKTA